MREMDIPILPVPPAPLSVVASAGGDKTPELLSDPATARKFSSTPEWKFPFSPTSPSARNVVLENVRGGSAPMEIGRLPTANLDASGGRADSSSVVEEEEGEEG